MKNISSKLWLGSLGLLATVGLISAQTWDGGASGGNANWGTANNWDLNTVPSATGIANIIFSGTVKPNVNVNVAANVNSIIFSPGVAFVLSGGSLTLQGGGIVNSAFNNGINVATLSLGASQTWQANGGNLSFGGTTLNLNANNLILSGANNFTIGNAITGSGGITKTSSGSLTLNGVNSYTGPTVISAGTLTGSGSLSSAVTMQSGTTLNAGNNGAGQITVGDLTLDNGPKIVFEVQQAGGVAGTGYDLIVAPTLTINSGTPIVIDVTSLDLAGSQGAVADFDNAQGYTWELVRTTGGINNFSESAFDIQLGNFVNDTGMGDFNISTDGNSLFLNFTPVPEPSTIAFGGIAGAMLLGSMLRRKKK